MSLVVGGNTGRAKLEDVTRLIDELRISKDSRLSSTDLQRLEQLKVYGRVPENADPIFTKAGIELFAHFAFESTTNHLSREALRILANALLLKEETRQLLVDCGVAPKAAEKLKSNNSDDEFLLSRILFLMTYGSNANFEKLISDNQLGETINQHLSRHAQYYIIGPHRLAPMDDMALTETCKLLFNITHFHPDLTTAFSTSIPSLLTILHKSKISNPPLQTPLSSVINALIPLDLAEACGHHYSPATSFPMVHPKAIPKHLVNILDASMRYYKAAELDQTAAPVLSLIRKIYGVASESVKKDMESLLLPTDSERSQPLGKSNTLPSRLLQLSSSALTPTLRTSISALMFELSGEDATRFVHNVGYGFAAGFLMSQNMEVPQNAGQAFADADGGAEVNPITGQRLDLEQVVDEGPPMTDEEKEREAERLFVLFERLRATGVVDVVNPITRARDEGRFEELPD